MFIETESTMVGARLWGKGTGSCLMGTEFLFCKMRKFWRQMVVMVAQCT